VVGVFGRGGDVADLLLLLVLLLLLLLLLLDVYIGVASMGALE